jgi:hypothetical protein
MSPHTQTIELIIRNITSDRTLFHASILEGTRLGGTEVQKLAIPKTNVLNSNVKNLWSHVLREDYASLV